MLHAATRQPERVQGYNRGYGEGIMNNCREKDREKKERESEEKVKVKVVGKSSMSFFVSV